MELNQRVFVLIIHLLLGAGLVHFFFVGIAALRENTQITAKAISAHWTTALLAWAACVGGTWILYPWYRAKPPEGLLDIAAYPRWWLISKPNLALWQTVGMEWKEHIAWLCPILLTVVAASLTFFESDIKQSRSFRKLLLGMSIAAFACALVAAAMGVILNKVAPNLFLFL